MQRIGVKANHYVIPSDNYYGWVCHTKEQMDLFHKACISSTAVSANEMVDAMQFYRYWIGYFELYRAFLLLFDFLIGETVLSCNIKFFTRFFIFTLLADYICDTIY